MGARNRCHGAVSGFENEDLAHLWWNCKAEQYAHVREKVPQNTTVEAMRPAYKDMMLAQKDTQLLDWERNNRINEVAAVAAAEELRSKVGRSTTEMVEARRVLGRLQKNSEGTSGCRRGRMGRALTRDGKQSREQEQESSSRKTVR